MKPGILFALLLAGAVTGALVQRSALSRVRAENRRLREQGIEAQRLARGNENVDQLRKENHEVENLRNETRDLHKLRNEVRQLREQKPAWDKLRAENQRLRVGAKSDSGPASGASEPANMIAKERLSDAGFGSPEATLQTFLWAMREGNIGSIRNCISEEAIKQGIWQPIEDAQGGAPPLMAGFKGFRVVAKKVVSADQVKLGIQISADGESSPPELAIPFKRVGSEWKIDLVPQ
jgi:hypothetical protein